MKTTIRLFCLVSLFWLLVTSGSATEKKDRVALASGYPLEILQKLGSYSSRGASVE